MVWCRRDIRPGFLAGGIRSLNELPANDWRQNAVKHGDEDAAILLQRIDEVAFPVTWNRSVIGFGGTLGDHDVTRDEVLAPQA